MSASNRHVVRMDRMALVSQFPAAFEAKGNRKPKRPLKVGIREDIIARGGLLGPSGHPVNTWRLHNALRDYTAGRRYQAALAAGAMRVDLDGNEIEAVTPNVQEEAKQKIAAMDAKRDAKAA